MPMTLDEARDRIETLQERVRQLEGMSKPSWTSYDKLPFTDQERKLLALLLKTGVASHDNTLTLLWGEDPTGGPDKAEAHVKVIVCTLRRKLAAFGAKIGTIYKFGYVMTKEDRKKVLDADPEKYADAIRAAARERKPPREKQVGRPTRAYHRTGKWKW